MTIGWYPDETLFSLVSRCHVAYGHRHAEQTCLMLFGHRRQGVAHDLPAHIDEFVRRTTGTFGTAEDIILERTLLPFFLPFRKESVACLTVTALRSGPVGPTKAKLGLLASRFGAAHPLKACIECMREDVATFGVAYWHRDHQWPGAWICARHEQVLQRGLGKVNTLGRFEWWLPADLEFAPGVAPCHVDAVSASVRKLAGCACGLGSMRRGVHFDPQRLVQTYQFRLSSLGLASSAGRIRFADFGCWLEPRCHLLAHAFGLEALRDSATKLATQFARLVHAHRVTVHPLKHLLLISMLFDSWQEFTAFYRSLAPERSPELGVVDPQPCATGGASVSLQREVVDLVRVGYSASAAARKCGVSVASAMAWAARDGLEVPRRPKKLILAQREKAVDQLRRGMPKEHVAADAGVSVGTITTLLRTVPDLSREWRQAVFARAQRCARATWTQAARSFTNPRTKTLRRHHPAAYAWLYRNDLEWLREFTGHLPPPRRTNNVAIDWVKRDRQMANAVLAAATMLRATGARRRLNLASLCDQVLGLKARTDHLRQFPLTRAAIALALQRRQGAG